jgi:hypothetical protein
MSQLNYLAKSVFIIYGAIVSQSSHANNTFELSLNIGSPIIDGDLSDSIWQSTPNYRGLTQIWPIIKDTHNYETKTKITRDKHNLYVAMDISAENYPIVANTLKHRGDISGDDRVTVYIDSQNSGQNAYWFEVNANGVKNDGLLVNNSNNIEEWDGVWQAHTRQNAQGWAVEIAIPFSLLSFNATGNEWGINIVQHVESKQVQLRASNLSQDVEYFDPKYFDKVAGFAGIKASSDLDMRYSINASTKKTSSERSNQLTPSLDAFYKLTPSISASLTLNSDFSTVDVDERQLNLGRFSLFFPEKRDFFLQDAGVFEFGDLSRNGRPFFSRKIGLAPNGEPLDIKYGVKISGDTDRFSFGVLSSNVDSIDNKGANQLSVARGLWKLNESVQIGAIATDGNPSADSSSQTYGTDVKYRTSELFNGKLFEAGAWLQSSNNEGSSSNEGAWGASIAYPNDILNFSYDFMELQDNFNPALGFVNRNDIRNHALTGRFRKHVNNFGLQRVEHSLNATYVTDLDNHLLSSTAYFNYLDLTTKDGSFIRVALEDSKDNLKEAFNLLGKLPIQPKNYHFQRHWLIIQSSNAKRFNFDISVNFGDYFDGTKRTAKIETFWKPSLKVNASLMWKKDQIEIEDQRLSFSLYRFSFDYIFNNKVSWNNLFQYDDISKKLGVSSRFQWVHKPGFETNLIFRANYIKTEHNSWQSEVENTSINYSGYWQF